MNILLVNPPNPWWKWPPLGLGYLAAVLGREGHKVKVVDLTVEPAYVGAYLLMKKKFNWVGFTATSQTFQSALDYAHIAKGWTVFGGSHPSMLPYKTYGHKEVDTVVKGEGEAAVLQFCEDPEVGVIIKPPLDISMIPFPSRRLLPMGKYDYPGSILTSRGCPYQCSFCTHSVSGYKWRGRKPESVVDEIEHLKVAYTPDIYVVDDNFSLDINRAKAIMDGIVHRDLQVNLHFYNGLRADRIDEELANTMKVAGTRLVSFGLESVNDTVLRNMGKSLTLEQVEHAITLAHEAGLKVRLSLMIGNKGDTLRTVRDTIKWVKENPLIDDAEFSQCTVYPGTPLHKWVEEHGQFLTDPENPPTYFMDRDTPPSFDTPEFPADQRVKALREAQKMVQRKFLWKNRSLKNFRVQNIPAYTRRVVSAITGKRRRQY